MVPLTHRAPQASWKAHTLCLHFESAFMAPCGWLGTTDDRRLPRYFFQVKQHTLSSAYPVTMLTNRTSIVSPLLPFPSLSLLLSYQHPLVRSGTQHAATPLWNLKLPGCKRPFTGNAFANAEAITRVWTHQRFSLNCHRVQRLWNHLSWSQVVLAQFADIIRGFAADWRCFF